MAICYARLEFLKRTSGKNAVAKSAYNSRDKAHFEGNQVMAEKTYSWLGREKPAYHQIMLPGHVDRAYLSAEFLWNAVEKAERKKNAVVGSELVLALPDDDTITLEDKIELTKSFVHQNFISKGFAAQIDIHSPENAITNSEVAEEEKGSNNWHAHIQVTPRRFLEDGKTFEKNKPRENVTELRGGRVISGLNWGKLWTQHQNEYFEQRGLNLRVDPSGVVPQKHLGPYRMRGRAFSLLSENDALMELNQLESSDAQKILGKIIETKSVFSKEEVDQFLQKHVTTEKLGKAKEDFWALEEIVELLDSEGQKTALYSTHSIVDEEAQILRLADKLQAKNANSPSRKVDSGKIISKLSEEQATAFKNLTVGRKLACIDGHAGTGKSHLLAALKEYYQKQGLTVRAFGPDNATVKVLEEKGFEKAENVHRFLFSLHNKKREISFSNEVWVVDEAGKLGNKPLLELLKEAEKNNVHLILSGSTSQISSVERGGSFKIFCEKYGSQSLSNIQRQKYESQRQMAQSIAVGDVSQAIHKLCANGGIHWTQNREDAFQELVHLWSKDLASFPISSTLIIARSNQEIRVLNELARQVLKEKGMLEEKEYHCETAHGPLYISVGDRIEFRKNDKDLGVTNGMSGTLTQASEIEFAVLLDSVKGEKKTVKFDPRYYHSYQLGYASTFYRSQGRTVDRAYVLHSPGMNKAEFYVGVTRHVRTVHFFVSREQAKSLSHLKWHLDQNAEALSTLKFTTQKEIDLNTQKNKRNQDLQTLKQSDKFLERIGGYSLGLWDALKQKGKDYYNSKKDLHANSAFYNPKIDTSSQKVQVTLVEEEESKSFSLSEIKSEQQTTQPSSIFANSWTFLSQDKKNALEAYYSHCDKASFLREIVESEANNLAKEVKFTPHFREWQEACGSRNFAANQLVQTIPNDELKNYVGELSFNRIAGLSDRYMASQEIAVFETRENPKQGEYLDFNNASNETHLGDEESRRRKFTELPEDKQKAVQNYQQSVREAVFMREAISVEAESQGKDMKELSRFKELQKAWGERNKNASQLLTKLSQDDLGQIFGESRAHAIKEQAKRFEEFQDKSKRQLVSYEELEKKLLDNAEALLYRLYPEGPNRKEHNKIRYGRKGSLCVKVSGQKAGSFYDFERQEGGGLLKLIAVSQNLSKGEAESWAKEFLNISNTIQVPKYYQTTSREQKESQWVSVQPGKGDAPKELSKISSADFLKDFREDARYSYKDIDGNLLFYTVRLVDKNDSGKKLVLPLSCGHWKNHSKRCHWSFKQYAANDRPLYNLHCLKENPGKPILIVEGEKAANAASQQFPDFVVISWAGGSGAVSKTNWAPLQGKDVLIWPDNDKAGFKAGEQISSELRKLGMKSLRMIDLEKLSREFPEKWDLADSLPDGKKPQDISDMMLLAKEKAINPAHVLLHIQGSSSHPAHVTKVNEILWRVDERMRGSLEQLHGNKTWNVNEAIIRESVKIFSEEKEIRSKICKDFGANDALQDRLTHQAMIFSAQHGKAPSLTYMSALKEKIRDAAWLQDVTQKIASTTKNQAIQNFVLDNTITQMINRSSAQWNQNEAKNVVDRVLKQVEVADTLQQGKLREHSREIAI